MQDVIQLCENCEVTPSISTTDDDVELCAACELALIDEMAGHGEECECEKDLFACETVSSAACECGGDFAHAINCPRCTCGVLGRVERRKLWLRAEVAKTQTPAPTLAAQ